MCAVSQVGDVWTERFGKMYPSRPWEVTQFPPSGLPGFPVFPPFNPSIQRKDDDSVTAISPSSDVLRKIQADMVQAKKELIAAKQQDEQEGNPDCEMEEKVALLRQIAKAVGVDLSDVFPEEAATETDDERPSHSLVTVVGPCSFVLGTANADSIHVLESGERNRITLWKGHSITITAK